VGTGERGSLVGGQVPERQRQADEHRPAHTSPATLERFGDRSRARHAVAFTRQKQRGIVRVKAVSIDANELGDRLRVAARLIELGSVLGFDRPAVAGADGIDEDEIGEVEPAAAVVHRHRWRSGCTRPETPRSKPQQMDERRTGAGAAIPEKRERPGRCRGRPLHRVGGKEHLAVHLAGLVVANREPARARRVAERCAADHHLTGGRHDPLLALRLKIGADGAPPGAERRRRGQPSEAKLHVV
jgi:hypothetical protein